MNRKLVAIVTGMQHSGTTYLNNIINSHPRIMSGFECGIGVDDSLDIKQGDILEIFTHDKIAQTI